jgi:hypothetical protein
MYDYYLGGKDNFAADREAAEAVISLMPGSRFGARANRDFLMRAVHYLVAEAGIRQFLDLGAGLPTQNNVHEVALSLDKDAKVVYVDYDPVVCSHGRALVHGISNVGVVQEDLRNPDAVLHHDVTRALLDFTEPIAVMMVSILHFIASEVDVDQTVARYRDVIGPGSYLAISHLTGDRLRQARPEETELAQQVYSRASAPVSLRGHDRILCLFDGLELVEPGLVWLSDWHRDSAPTVEEPGLVRLSERCRDGAKLEALGYGGKIPAYAGVGRKPG